MTAKALAFVLAASVLVGPAALSSPATPDEITFAQTVPTQAAPARDAVGPSFGSATVSGLVVTDETPARPLRRVRVTVQSADLRAPVSGVTDDAGRFVLTRVVAGHYTLMAARPGYVDTVLGAAAGGFLGSPIAVAEAEHVDGLTIRMPRGGVITGAVRYPSGRPARGIQLVVTQVKLADGKRRSRFSIAAGAGGVMTDDRGIYRQFGLAPGDYLVQVMPLDALMGSGALRQTTADELAWAERVGAAAASTSGARSGGPGTAPGPGRSLVPAAIYYPGTTDIETARLISIKAGEERAGVDLVLDLVPTSVVSGMVTDEAGQPRAGASLRLTGRGGSSLADMVGSLLGRADRSGPDGTFSLAAVPPGDYTLSAQVQGAAEQQKPGDASEVNLMAMFSGAFGRGGGAGSLHASEKIVVTGQDVSGVSLRLRQGTTISGRVVFEGTAAPPAPSAIQVMLASNSGLTGSPLDAAMLMLQSASGPVSPDLTFSLKGVVPNSYRAAVTLPGMFPGVALPGAVWILKSVRMGNGPDLADMPFDVEIGRDLSGLVVTLTDRPTTISGRVLDGAGRPASAFPIVIFSTDSAHWVVGSRRVQQVRPASDGSYLLKGLPAGEYYMGAVTTFDLEDLYDPSFLQQIVPIAFRLTLSDGEIRQQDLKIGG